MSETSAKSRHCRTLISSSAARPVNRSASRAHEEAWMTHAADWPFNSIASFAGYVHDGSSGKTYPTSFDLIADSTSTPSSVDWQNSGMGTPTECWTLNTSECPNDGSVSLLSAVLETGDLPPECSLTPHNIERMRTRLLKYVGSENRLLGLVNRYADGLGMKPLNMESRSLRLCGPHKEERESA